ncbi:MAG TPA: hypothetical protein PLY87_17425 [Planctomycetaceae bacterium]|nr:hypothetical protein [Planctomycetaceae bacterium]HQZ66879.1 hypothetical protein [Planctomycetaceae bacterium]
MSKPTVYVETTVVGHLAGRQQSDIIVAARQLASRKWWDMRERYQLFVSRIESGESEKGSQLIAATKRGRATYQGSQLMFRTIQ